MTKQTRRTTVVVDEWFEQAVTKARGLGLTMSQVHRGLMRAWVQGDIDVKIVVGGKAKVERSETKTEQGKAEQESNLAATP